MEQNEQMIMKIDLTSTSPSLQEQVAQFALNFQREVEALNRLEAKEHFAYPSTSPNSKRRL